MIYALDQISIVASDLHKLSDVPTEVYSAGSHCSNVSM